MSDRSPLDHFSTREDRRQALKVAFPLPEALPIVLCGVMGGDDLVEIERRARRKPNFLRRLPPFARGARRAMTR